MSSTGPSGGGQGGPGKGKKTPGQRLKSFGNKINPLKSSSRGGSSGSSGGPTFLSPNQLIPLAEQSGMIIPARGKEGALIAMLDDGTWNDAVRASAPSDAQTNITRLFNSFEISTDPSDDKKSGNQPYTGKVQIPIYQAGVGNETQGNPVMKKVNNLLGGGIGKGISRNIIYAYVEVCTRYQPGDKVFVLGFSRGAFTALSLESFTADVGIIKIPGSTTPADARLPPDFRVQWDEVASALFEAWLNKRSSGVAWAMTDYPTVAGIKYEVIKANGISSIEGLMVYDPVAAYKLPATGAGHPKTALEKTIQDVPAQVRTLQVAYALNEYRYPFTEVQLQAQPDPTHRVALVWWPGDHGNIGGGSTQPLNISQNTFLFISNELEAAGFRLDQAEIAGSTSVQVGPRQALQNSYSGKTYGIMGGKHYREPLPIHNISRMAREWEQYTQLSEEGILELLEPIFTSTEPQASPQGGFAWVTKASNNTVPEWTGPAGGRGDGLKAVTQMTSADEGLENRGPASGLAGEGRAVGQDPTQQPNVTNIGLNMPHEKPHTPTQLQ